ncbi:MAG: RluA family pseudouridine synthase [Desulfobacteraceae bacterium]
MNVEFKISCHCQGERLDQVVALHVADCSRNCAASMVKTGRILVCQARKKPGYRVKEGDVITGEVALEPEILPVQAQSLAIEILYDDDHIAVLNKQAGMVVHPGAGNPSGTLVNALLYHFPQLDSAGEERLRAGIVHRLDKETSGVMVVAKTEAAVGFLKQEFKQRRVVKQYLALATGSIKDPCGRVELPIGRHPVKRKMMSTTSARPRAAVTLWQVKKRFSRATLVEVELKTGRTHQIRVHFKALGHALMGDRVYGSRQQIKHRKTRRQMLHAWKLCFRHPWSKKLLAFTAPLPADFRRQLHKLHRESRVQVRRPFEP